MDSLHPLMVGVQTILASLEINMEFPPYWLINLKAL